MRDDKSTAKPAKTNLTWKVSSVASKSEDLNHAFGLTLLKATLNQIRFCKSSVSSHRQSNAKDFNNAEPNLFLQIKREKPSPKQREGFESNAEPNSCLQIKRE